MRLERLLSLDPAGASDLESLLSAGLRLHFRHDLLVYNLANRKRTSWQSGFAYGQNSGLTDYDKGLHNPRITVQKLDLIHACRKPGGRD